VGVRIGSSCGGTVWEPRGGYREKGTEERRARGEDRAGTTSRLEGRGEEGVRSPRYFLRGDWGGRALLFHMTFLRAGGADGWAGRGRGQWGGGVGLGEKMRPEGDSADREVLVSQ